jgi:uncharacterized protein (TIGR02996 family)
MDPHLPFLKAIVANRHDDLPRLVYADFLEETGDPPHLARAHFIRTQIHLETADPKSALFAEMKALEARLLDMYLDEWQHELPEALWYQPEERGVKWRRGFVDDLGPMSVNEFQNHGSAALGELPITSVQLADTTSDLNLHVHPDLAHVTRLRLGPGFTMLTHPVITNRLLDEEGTFLFNSLFTSNSFHSLHTLDLSENRITDAWLVRFAQYYPHARFAPTLETLDLSRNFGITDAGANVLATAVGLDRLKRLIVTDTDIGKSGMSMLRKRFGSKLANGLA